MGLFLWWNFATDSFVQMLSEARKYKLFLTMAEQSTSRQDDPKIVDTILPTPERLFASGQEAQQMRSTFCLGSSQ